MARRAGIQHAKIATPANTTTTRTNVSGSVGVTSNSMLARKRVSAWDVDRGVDTRHF